MISKFLSENSDVLIAFFAFGTPFAKAFSEYVKAKLGKDESVKARTKGRRRVSLGKRNGRKST